MPKGVSPSPETRARLRVANAGRKRTPEQVERIREGAKRAAAIRWANPDYRDKVSQAQKRRFEDPEERARIRQVGADANRRAAARKTVLDAGLPLWRHLVERAIELRRTLPKSVRREDIVEILRSEFARKQAA